MLPDLGHTGVQREMLPSDQPLFYLNGHKTCGLGATIRNALRESSPSISRRNGLRCRHQRRPTSKEDGNTVSSSPFYSSHGTRSEGAFAATPTEQCGRYPRNVWETPPKACNTGKCVSSLNSAGNLSTPTTQGCARTGDLNLVESQNQHDIIASPLRAKTTRTSAANKRRWSSNLVRVRKDGLCRGRWDSEWSTERREERRVERRAADKEAMEVLRAMRCNNARLWFLVGGGLTPPPSFLRPRPIHGQASLMPILGR